MTPCLIYDISYSSKLLFVHRLSLPTPCLGTMSFLPSTQILLFPFVLLFSIPVGVFATITTILAFSILSIRVTFVYIELVLAIIPHYLLGETTTKQEYDALKSKPSSPTLASSRRKKRRTSSNSITSPPTGTITPENLLGLSQSLGLARDFEGVGGWRLEKGNDEEAIWTSLNSRLELPAEHGRRHHRRSLTSGSLPGDKRRTGMGTRNSSPEEKMNTGKARASPAGFSRTEEYFPTRGLKRDLMTSSSSVRSGNSASSGNSVASSVLVMKQR